MTQEEKQLLLKDLSARVPFHKTICKIGEHSDYILSGIDLSNESQPLLIELDKELFPAYLEHVKPYLRPMSSMTEEELDELLDGENSDFAGKSELVKRAMIAYSKGDVLLSNELFSMQYAKNVDWLNEHQFDFRGLIPMGLALEATEGMYKMK